MKVEIPPEAVDALARDLAGRLIVSRIDRHYAAFAGLQEVAPILFASWSERLTSDEAVAALHRGLLQEEWLAGELDFEWGRGAGTTAEQLKRALAVVAAALASVSGKEGADAS